MIAAARGLADVIWSREIEGGTYATPERRAALEARIGELSNGIRDEVVRRYYRQDLAQRLQRTFAPEAGRGSYGRGNFRVAARAISAANQAGGLPRAARSRRVRRANSNRAAAARRPRLGARPSTAALPGGQRLAVVVTGSMGGLFAALLLRKVGWTVDVFERADVELSGRGAGIVTHAELCSVLEAVGLDSTKNLGVAVQGRKTLDCTAHEAGQQEAERDGGGSDGQLQHLVPDDFVDEGRTSAESANKSSSSGRKRDERDMWLRHDNDFRELFGRPSCPRSLYNVSDSR